jgi:hypothetical protein
MSARLPARTVPYVRLRDQLGQTATEYIGGLFLVAVIIAAIVSGGAPEKVAAETSRIVCRIAGGTDCGEPPKPPETKPGDPNDNHDGVPLPNGPLEVLPFPGSVTVTCTVGKQNPAPTEDPKRCKAPKAPDGRSATVQASTEVTVERSPTKLNNKGCPIQVLSLTTKFKLEGSQTAKDKKLSGKLAVFLGAQSKYQVTVAPDQAEDIEHGRRDAPNPIDPRTIRPGESVQLSEEFYTGHNLQAEYRALQVQLGYEEGRRVSSGVTRLNDNTVRIYVGDEDFVRNALALGIGGKGAKISIGNTKELSDGKLHAIDVDISSVEGWNAYQQFVGTGKLPDSGTPGTSNPANSKTLKYTDSTKVEGELGPIKVGGLLGDSEGNLTETTYADGSVETSLTGRYNDVGIEIVRKVDKDGNPIGQPTYAINAEGVNENAYAGWRKAQGYSGDDLKLPPGGNVRLEFTEGDLLGIQNQALEQIAYELEEWGVHPRPSAQEVKDNIERNGNQIKWGPNGAPFSPRSPIALLLANRDSPDEIAAALFHLGTKGKDVLFNDLASFSFRTAMANGDFRHPDERSRFPGRVVSPSCQS